MNLNRLNVYIHERNRDILIIPISCQFKDRELILKLGKCEVLVHFIVTVDSNHLEIFFAEYV